MITDSVTDAATALASLRDAVDRLLAVELCGLDRDGLLELVGGVETQARRLPVMDHRLIAELDARGVGFEVGARDTTGLLRDLLRLSPGEARARVRAAADLGPRRGHSGEVLPALFAAVAAAQAAGVISVRHAKVITDTVDALPSDIQSSDGAAVQASLVVHAQHLDPGQLATAARRVTDLLDPDGTLADDRDHDRRREAALSARRDGSGDLHAHLTPAALAIWQAVLDPLAAPAPAADRQPDPRTPGQRLHDGLLDAGQRLLASATLPGCGGTPVTIAVTMTLEQLEARTGLATTGHGGTLSVAELLRHAAEAELIPAVLNNAGGILAYGHTRRIASPAQRRALTIRDGGCSFPGCTIPASWTQAHHVRPWIDGGPTDLANLTLVCGYHHREFANLGWSVTITDQIPHWIPPAWLDPHQTPRRNHTHHPERTGPLTDRIANQRARPQKR